MAAEHEEPIPPDAGGSGSTVEVKAIRMPIGRASYAAWCVAKRVR